MDRTLFVGTVGAIAAACSSPPAASPDAAGDPDAAPSPDAQPPDAAVPDAATVRRLSETGLYEDIGEKRIHPDALEYAPAYELWSDGAEKTRWLILPEGEDVAIDSEDMDRWEFPVGTRAFKEFRVEGLRIETRLIEKTGPESYWMGAFLWDEQESDALFVEYGEDDARGSDHDVPAAHRCIECHEGEPGRILGFSAIQLAHEGEPNLDSIAEAGWLSDPPGDGDSYGVPGEGATKKALGYLHANCGNCHNPLGPAWADGEMNLRLSVDEDDPAATAIHDTTVEVPLERFSEPGYEFRVAPGDLEASALYYRMSVGSDVGRDRMPPLATDEVDEEGLGAVGTWIESLEPEP